MESISLEAHGLAEKLIDEFVDASLRLLFGPDSAEAGSKMVKGYIDRGVDMRSVGSDEIRKNPEFIELRRGIENNVEKLQSKQETEGKRPDDIMDVAGFKTSLQKKIFEELIKTRSQTDSGAGGLSLPSVTLGKALELSTRMQADFAAGVARNQEHMEGRRARRYLPRSLSLFPFPFSDEFIRR